MPFSKGKRFVAKKQENSIKFCKSVAGQTGYLYFQNEIIDWIEANTISVWSASTLTTDYSDSQEIEPRNVFYDISFFEISDANNFSLRFLEKKGIHAIVSNDSFINTTK